MNKFKVGDKVRCIDGLGIWLEENKEYTVSKVYTKYEEQLAFLEVEGYSGVWFPTRFELVEKEKAKPMITEFKVGQTYKTSSNIIATITAVGEKRLLAKYEDGTEFSQLISSARKLWTEYVKPIEVGSRVYSNISDREFTVTAIHDGYAWVHTEGSKGGSIQNLPTLTTFR